MRKLLRPVMMCPYCEYTRVWSTSSYSAQYWDKHIRECKEYCDSFSSF